MKDLAAGLGGKLEEFVALARNGAARWSADAEMVSAFEQSPHCTLPADSASLRIVGSNEAMRRALGFAAKDLLQLSLPDVFCRAGEDDSFVQLLRGPDPKVPLRARQRSRNGRLVDVEIVGYRVEGIEGFQQLAKLRELGCHFARGHLFSRAVPASRILPYLEGGLIELDGFDPNADTREGTGLHGALLEELLLSQTGS